MERRVLPPGPVPHPERGVRPFWRFNQWFPNVRFADERTYEFCFDGIPENSVIAIGTHGNTRSRVDLSYMINGFQETVKRLAPSVIIIYGSAPLDITSLLEYHKTAYTVFKSETGLFFARKKIIPAIGPLLPWDIPAINEGA